jgi:UDP-glucose 4-epimerase
MLVTGGCGFIGSHLCAQLVSMGYDVAVMDNLSLGSLDNLPLATRTTASLAVVDIRDTVAVRRYLRYFRPSVIFHLAAVHFIPTCDADPMSCISANVDGTQSVFDACAGASSVESIVVASSAAVYKPDSSAHHEDSALGPTDIYGHTKLWTEQLGALFHKKSGTSVGIARIFNVFGPGETNPHLIPSIIRQAEEGNDVCVGDLSTHRDYVFVGDVASAIIRLAGACHQHGLLTCNIGSERQVDGYRLVRIVEELLGRHIIVRVDQTRMRVSDRSHLLSDCQRAHELLAWHAETTLEVGLSHALHQPVASGLAA